MFSARDFVIFLAGALFFHAISHAVLPYIVTLPMDFNFMILTPGMNHVVIVCNLVITLILLFIAYRMGKPK